MNNPAFLVDGEMEKKIIQRLCPGSPVRLINCNGDNVELEAVAKRVTTLIKVLDNNKYYPIVILIDREDRKESYLVIKSKLLKLIKNNGINTDIIVGVADRTIENWILSDLDSFLLNLRGRKTKKEKICHEGTNGKGKLISYLPKEQKYHETTDGPKWFCSSNPTIMERNSPSFKDFKCQLSILRCRWLVGTS